MVAMTLTPQEDHVKPLLNALIKLEIIKNGATELPSILNIFTGRANESIVYLMMPGEGDNWQQIFAKFEKNPSRASREWDAIEALRDASLPDDPRFLLPFANNERKDRVIITPAAGHGRYRQSSDGSVVTLAAYRPLSEVLKDRSEDSKDNCFIAVRKTLETASAFHGPPSLRVAGKADNRPRFWRDVVGELDPKNTAVIRKDLPTSADIEPFRSGAADIDPFREIDDSLQELLNRPLDWHEASYAHNDLNLENVIIGFDRGGCAEDAFLIDFAASENNLPIIVDFIKLEVDMWRNILEPISKLSSPCHVYARVTPILDFLCGRRDTLPHDMPESLIRFTQFLCDLHNHVVRDAKDDSARIETFKQYQAGVSLLAARAMKYEDVVRSPIRRTALWLVSTSALQSEKDLERNRIEKFTGVPRGQPTLPGFRHAWSGNDGNTTFSADTTFIAESHPRTYYNIKRSFADNALNKLLLGRSDVFIHGSWKAGKSWTIGWMAEAIAQHLPKADVVVLRMRQFIKEGEQGGIGNLYNWILKQYLVQTGHPPHHIQVTVANQLAKSLDAAREFLERLLLPCVPASQERVFFLFDDIDQILKHEMLTIDEGREFFLELHHWKTCFTERGHTVSIVASSTKSLEDIDKEIDGRSFHNGTYQPHLSEFGISEITALATRIGIELSHADIETIQALTAGRPGFVDHILQEIKDQRLDGISRWKPEDFACYRDTLRSQIHDKIERLPDEAQTALSKLYCTPIGALPKGATKKDLEKAGLIHRKGNKYTVAGRFVEDCIPPDLEGQS